MSSDKLGLSPGLEAVGNVAEAQEAIIKQWAMGNLNNRLPCIVESVNEDSTTVTVTPLVAMMNTKFEEISRGEKFGIHVYSPGTSKIFMRFKIEKGDLGWIEACDRDISKVMQAIKTDQSIKEHKPNTLRMFSYSDAKFIPAYMMDKNFNSNCYIGNPEGTLAIEFNDTSVDMTAATFNLAGDAVLGISGTPKFIARIGDEVEIPINGASGNVVVTAATGAVFSSATLKGTITTASSNQKAN